MRLLFASIALAALAATCGTARAAQSLDNCTGFIDSAPAVINVQGTWCLRRDVATNLAAGAAIEIHANNVTIDCNDFKLGNLAAGASSRAIGVLAEDRHQVSVLRCTMRGFHSAVALLGGDGARVAGNRFDGNLVNAIVVDSLGGIVRDNRILDTGEPDYEATVVAILASGGTHVLDNVVQTATAAGDGAVHAILAIGNPGASIARNLIGDVFEFDGAPVVALGSPGLVFRANQVVLGGNTPGLLAIDCDHDDIVARDNLTGDYVAGTSGCHEPLAP